MAPARELREMIRRAMLVPRVVGAGIGARPPCGLTENSREPVLTVLVDERAPGDDLRIASSLSRDSRPVEVIEVGRVSVLGSNERKG